MNLYKDRYRAESARLKGWDYSAAGYYFVTICIREDFKEVMEAIAAAAANEKAVDQDDESPEEAGIVTDSI